jgi:acyl carrier protein
MWVLIGVALRFVWNI